MDNNNKQIYNYTVILEKESDGWLNIEVTLASASGGAKAHRKVTLKEYRSPKIK